MNIGKATVALCKAKGITRKELAERMGISQNAMCDLVKGRSWPSALTMYKLTQALDVPQSYILFFSIEDIDIPQEKRELFHLLANPLKEYLMK
jgi:transcriptional regulator with XRE-family HTH domain